MEDMATKIIANFADTINQYPSGYTQFLCGLDFAIGPAKEIIIAGEPDNPDTKRVLSEIWKRFIPGKILLLHSERDKTIEEIAGFVKEQKPIDGKTTVYICENYTCKTPTNNIERVIQLLEGL